MPYLPPNPLPDVPTMLSAVNATVAGLDDPKKRLLVSLRRHMVAAANERPWREPNLLIAGHTGSGKSFFVREALKASGLPFIEVNATQYSEVGYVGRDLSSQFRGLLEHESRTDAPLRVHKEQMERWGVVVIDEIDKWRHEPAEITRRGPTGRALQAELLRLCEGDIAMVQERDGGRSVPFRTHNILFIGTGSFAGVEPLVKRDNPHAEGAALWSRLAGHHLIQYGFMPELIGRFATVLPLPPLTVHEMTRILQEHVWPVWQQRAVDEGFELMASPEVVRDLANMAANHPIGARALDPLINEIVAFAWGEATPGDQVVITIEALTSKRAEVKRPRAKKVAA